MASRSPIVSGLDTEGRRLWRVVAATVRPLPGRGLPNEEATPVPATPAKAGTRISTPAAAIKAKYAPAPSRAPDPIEPNRRRHLTRASRPADSVLDLHGYDQDRARAALTNFILRAHAAGERAVLVITGKGALGDGVLRRRTPEWLAEPPLRPIVAGLSEAHRRHGGEGALYVALKRSHS